MASPLLVLKARAEARARMFDEGFYASLDEAMEPLVIYAVEQNIEQWRATAILLTAFEGRSDEI